MSLFLFYIKILDIPKDLLANFKGIEPISWLRGIIPPYT
ncbi:hypothetical protein LYNGBM3L_37280 [Moorena producens 3L]|uniref:Uncharacterized protein n=1 Tax=Moorena producens 3L TaxID=489825 RepID=F4XPY0_9CYAN|nr:hypothetical protein LYNGBM3L_37280 [Moorena producens 3L]